MKRLRRERIIKLKIKGLRVFTMSRVKGNDAKLISKLLLI